MAVASRKINLLGQNVPMTARKALRILVAAVVIAPAAATAAPRAVSLVVRNGTVVTMDADRRVIASGAVAVDGGRIVAVGPAAEIDAGYRGREVVDAGGGLVIPGLVNAHAHAPMVLFRGIADDLKLMDWLQKYIFPAEKKNVTAAFVKAGTAPGRAGDDPLRHHHLRGHVLLRGPGGGGVRRRPACAASPARRSSSSPPPTTRRSPTRWPTPSGS